MSNAQDVRRKRFPIELDKTRYLCYDMESFIMLEEEFGSVGDSMMALREGKMKNVRKVLWLGLIDDDPDLTEQQTGKLILIPELPMITEVLFKAIGLALPDSAKETADKIQQFLDSDEEKKMT